MGGETFVDPFGFIPRRFEMKMIGLDDTGGAYVVKYTCDAWGVPLTITDGSGNDVSSNSSHIANINPYRYKGYYYDIYKIGKNDSWIKVSCRRRWQS